MIQDALYRCHLVYRNHHRSAATRFRYIARQREFAAHPDQLVHLESGNMPSVMVGLVPHAFWQAADRYSRRHGRRYFEIRVTLPRGLTGDQQVTLVRTFAQAVGRSGDDPRYRLPYTFAIHPGRGTNPHAHIMISPAQNDGVSRPLDKWFLRGNSKQPSNGGAPKAREITRHRWLLAMRLGWEQTANWLLREWNTGLAIDRRSLKDRGSTRIPTLPLGPVPRPGCPNPGRERKRQRNLEIEEENRRREQEQLQQVSEAEERRKELNRRAHEAFARFAAQPPEDWPDCRCEISDIDNRRRAGLAKLVRNPEFQEMTRRDLGRGWECGSDMKGIVWLHSIEAPVFDLGDRVIARSTGQSSALVVATLLARRTAGNIEILGPAEWRRQVRAAWRCGSELIARTGEREWALNVDHASIHRPQSTSIMDDQDTCDDQVYDLLAGLLRALSSNDGLKRNPSMANTRRP